jgi:hypothetical protein
LDATLKRAPLARDERLAQLQMVGPVLRQRDQAHFVTAAISCYAVQTRQLGSTLHVVCYVVTWIPGDRGDVCRDGAVAWQKLIVEADWTCTSLRRRRLE